MRRVRLGKSDLMVSAVGFGGIPITRVSFSEADRCIKRSLELGINFIDTATGYHDSEEKIGRSIQNCREQIILATKASPTSKEYLMESIDQSLRRLKTDYIDLFQLHNIPNEETLKRSIDLIEILDKAKQQGKILHIGATVHGVDWINEVIRTDLFETVMIAFNFIVNEPEQAVLPTAREYDVGVIAMKPMGGGHITNAKLAFKYFSGMEDVVPLVGIEKVEEIEEIVAIVEKGESPDDSDLQEMARIRKESGDRFCRRCGYCLPCEQGIKIPMVNIFHSLAVRMPVDKVLAGSLPAAVRDAVEKCTQCGACEERCPYDLDIQSIFKENYAFLQELEQEYEQEAD